MATVRNSENVHSIEANLEMKLVQSDDAIGPHIVWSDKDHSAFGPTILSLSREEIITLKEWCEAVTKANDWWQP